MSRSAVILVIDDEAKLLEAFRELLVAEGHEVLTATRADIALSLLSSRHPDVVITDIRMPGMSGLDALNSLRVEHPHLPVIVMTGQGTMETAIEATKRGAFDYHIKPFDPAAMLQTIERACEAARLMRRPVAVSQEDANPAGDAIIGKAPSMQEVFKTIGRAAATDAAVLIRGESGTGKELVARALYQHSHRASAPLVLLNCAAIPESLLESELFGHVRGAFTGALRERIGKFEQANGGTIFLDEIGDIPPAVQAKLLRVLHQREFHRVGGDEILRSDVRVLAATNRDLEKAIRDGAFRDDLYHRLNVITIHLPPLRERREDIPELVKYFVFKFARQLNIQPPIVPPSTLHALIGYNWPGNVRELEHCIHRTLILTGGRPIQVEDLALPDRRRAGEPCAEGPVPETSLQALVREYFNTYRGDQAHAQWMEAAERALIEEALQRAGGNRSQAAKLLGMPRPTLHAKAHRLHIRSESPLADTP